MKNINLLKSVCGKLESYDKFDFTDVDTENEVISVHVNGIGLVIDFKNKEVIFSDNSPDSILDLTDEVKKIVKNCCQTINIDFLG